MKNKYSKSGLHLPSFALGMTAVILLLTMIGIGITYFLAIAYDDEYTITLEPLWTIGTLNRAQQSYYIKHGFFSTSISNLQGYPIAGQGHLEESENYLYSVEISYKDKTEINNSAQTVISYGVPRQPIVKYRYGVSLMLHSYVGGVFLVPLSRSSTANSKNTSLLLSILCQSREPSSTKPNAPKLENNIPICGSGTRSVAP